VALTHHFLIAAGTARYQHLDTAGQLPSVVEDVALVAGFFTGLGFQRVLSELGDDPCRGDLERRLGGWLTAAERTARDVLIFYYSGHGESVDDDAHYLVFRDTEYSHDRPLPHTALADDQLVRLFAASPVQHAPLILDTCPGRGVRRGA
jgi:hypothetical protein